MFNLVNRRSKKPIHKTPGTEVLGEDYYNERVIRHKKQGI